jgi:hypothetical protein
MEIIGLTGIGMTTGIQILSFEGGAALSASLIGALVVSGAGILSSRLRSGWKRSMTGRPALRLHPAPAAGS